MNSLILYFLSGIICIDTRIFSATILVPVCHNPLANEVGFVILSTFTCILYRSYCYDSSCAKKQTAGDSFCYMQRRMQRTDIYVRIYDNVGVLVMSCWCASHASHVELIRRHARTYLCHTKVHIVSL